MELEEEVEKVRSLVGKEDSVVFLLGVLNLGAVFLYSVYNHITRAQRYLGAPNSYLSNEYIERKVQGILDELVLHVQTSTYYQNVINRDSSVRTVKQNVPNYSSFEDGSNFLRRAGLSSKRVDVDLGRRKFKVVRRKKSQRVERAAKDRYPPSVLLKSFFGNLSRIQTNPTPRPVLLKHYYQPLATADRFDSNVEEMKFVDTLKKAEKSTIRAPELRIGQSSETLKTQRPSTKKPTELKRPVLETPTRPYDEPTQSSVGFVRRLNEVVSIAAPLATSIFDVFANENYPAKCFEKTLCEANQEWRRKGVVAGTLSPLLSIVMSWTTKNQGSPPLADTLTAIRSGWVGQPCALLYSYCEDSDLENERHQKPQALAPYSGEEHRRVIQQGNRYTPQIHEMPLHHPLRHDLAPSNANLHPNTAQLTSRLDHSDEKLTYQSMEDEEDASEDVSLADEYSLPSGEEGNSIYAYQEMYEKLKTEQLKKQQSVQEYIERSSRRPEPSKDFQDSERTTKKPEITTSIKVKPHVTEEKSLPIETSTVSSTTTKKPTTTTTTTTTTLPPGRPRSNMDSAQVESSSAFRIEEKVDNVDSNERSFSPIEGLHLQDRFVKGTLLHQDTEEASAIWKPESSSFFDVSEAKPGIFYSINRWSKRARNSKVLRMPFLHR